MDTAALKATLATLAEQLEQPNPERLMPLHAGWRAAFMAADDPVLKARYLVLNPQLRSSSQVSLALMDDLLLALKIFRVNKLQRCVGETLGRLVVWASVMGLDALALTAGRAAMACSEVPLADRYRLATPLCMALARSGRYDSMMLLADSLKAAAEAADAAPQVRYHYLGTLATAHYFAALRATATSSVYTLVLPPLTRDMAVFEHHRQRVMAALDERRHLGPDLYLRPRYLALLASLRGDATEAQQWMDSYGTAEVRAGILGLTFRASTLIYVDRHEQALPLLMAVGQQLGDEMRHPLIAMNMHYAVYQCQHALGQPAQALDALQAYAALDARLHSAEPGLLRGLADALGLRSLHEYRDPLPQGQQTAASGDTNVHLRASLPPTLARARRVVVDRLPVRLTPASLAAHIGVNLRTLQAQARSHLGQTLTDMIRDQVVNQALQWLADPQLRIDEVAARCGYRSAAHFSSDVKRMTGASPLQLRQQGGRLAVATRAS